MVSYSFYHKFSTALSCFASCLSRQVYLAVISENGYSTYSWERELGYAARPAVKQRFPTPLFLPIQPTAVLDHILQRAIPYSIYPFSQGPSDYT